MVVTDAGNRVLCSGKPGRQAVGVRAIRAGAGEAVRAEAHRGQAGTAEEEAGEGAVIGLCPGNAA